MDKMTRLVVTAAVTLVVAVLIVWGIRPYMNWILVPQQIITGILNGGDRKSVV